MTSTIKQEGSAETNVTEVTAPTLTPTPTFHPFPNLPAELRLRIWKAACLPRTQNDRAIQYVTADVVQENWDDDDLVIFDEDVEYFFESDDEEDHETGYVTLRGLSGKKLHNSPPTNSAHLWDQGLWMACTESRRAIAKHLETHKWLPITGQRDEEYLSSVPWFHTYFPSILVPHRKAKHWRLIVVPRRDIFCISAANLRYLPKSLYGMKLLAPLFGQRKSTIIGDWNIALKFDSSWNDNLPVDLYDLKQEKTPRGLLANWMDMLADEFEFQPTLWIIDDTAGWVAHPDPEPKTVFRDCDAEYVLSYWTSLRDYTGNGELGDLHEFISHFAEILEDGGNPDHIGVLVHIQFLVRKDRQMPPEPEAEQ
ncbi:hypothetical protein QX201_012292 [Fusarium graminearum]